MAKLTAPTPPPMGVGKDLAFASVEIHILGKHMGAP
jgi:hypothetical protein